MILNIMDKYVIGGFISGIVQTLIGHPFDTIKVYYQNSLKKKIKLTNLYRGISYPLLTNSCVTSLNFSVYSYMREKFNTSHMISGGVSGIATGIVLTPIELYKIRRQLFVKSPVKPTKGFSSCLLREIPAFASYFSTYHYLKENNWSILNSGGIAGMVCWIITYPLDVIKTRVQSGKAQNIMSAFKQGSLFNGISICLLRSYPVNAIGFYSYEYIINKLS